MGKRWRPPFFRGEEKRVIGLGLACLDHLIRMRDCASPVAGNQVLDYTMQGGGPAATALVAVARLGGQAEFWGVVGAGAAGDFIIEGLEREKVCASFAVRSPDDEGPVYLVFVDGKTGERHIHGGKRLAPREHTVERLDRLAGAGCLLLDGHHIPSSLNAAREARRLGVPVVGDYYGYDDNTRKLIAATDYAIVSGHCARGAGAGDDWPQACRILHDLGSSHVVITLGDKGLVAYDGNTILTKKAFAAAVVDTTGAGDTFHGAFCLGLARGLAFAPNLSFASAAAALKCRKLGGRAGIPTAVEALEFLARPENGVVAEELAAIRAAIL